MRRAAAWYTYAQAHVKAGNLEEGIRGYTQAAIFGREGPGRKTTRRFAAAGGPKRCSWPSIAPLGLHYFEQGYDAVEPFSKAVEAARANGNKEQGGIQPLHAGPHRIVPTGITNRP